jgi:hypothetical protein
MSSFDSLIAYAIIFAFNFIIGLVLFCCFGCYRKHRTKPLDYSKVTEEMDIPPPPMYEESQESFGAILK